MTAILINKLSVRTVVGQPKVPPLGETVSLMKVAGVVTSVEPVQTQYGTSYRFRGAFTAIRGDNNQEYTSGQCFLPDVITDPLVVVLSSDNAPASVKFACEILIRGAADPVGYEYVVKPLSDIQRSSELEEMRNLMLGAPSVANVAIEPAQPEAKAKKK